MFRILAATDFSEASQPVLDFAANVTRQCGGKMYLLHVVHHNMGDTGFGLTNGDMTGAFCGLEIDPEHPNRILEVADRRAKAVADTVREKWGIPIYAKAEEHEDIVRCVARFCERHNVDQVVIGNRHHSIFSTILLGSTAEKLVRGAKVPVTVVPCEPNMKK